MNETKCEGILRRYEMHNTIRSTMVKVESHIMADGRDSV